MEPTDLEKSMFEMRVKRFNERMRSVEEETGMKQVAVLDFNQMYGIRPALVVVESKMVAPEAKNDKS